MFSTIPHRDLVRLAPVLIRTPKALNAGVTLIFLKIDEKLLYHTDSLKKLHVYPENVSAFSFKIFFVMSVAWEIKIRSMF